jgi:hypothetical protein
MGALVYPAALAVDRGREAETVRAWMELGLAAQPDRRRHREGEWHVVGELGVEPDLAAGLRFLPDLVGSIDRLGVRVRVLPIELTGDPFRVDDRADQVDGGGVRRRVHARAFGAVPLEEVRVDQAVQRSHLGRGVAGDSGRDASRLEYRDLQAVALQHVGRAEPGDPAADHDRIEARLAAQRAIVRLLRGLDPQRRVAFVQAAHEDLHPATGWIYPLDHLGTRTLAGATFVGMRRQATARSISNQTQVPSRTLRPHRSAISCTRRRPYPDSPVRSLAIGRMRNPTP